MTASTRTTMTPGQTETKRHPIRGSIWGLLMGLGLAVVAVVTKVVSLSLVTTIVLVVAGIVLGVLWGLYAPAKPPKGPAPAARTVLAPETSRFDDFDEPAPRPGDDAADAATHPVADGEHDTADRHGGDAAGGDDD